MMSIIEPTFIQVNNIAYQKWGGSNPTLNLANRAKMTAPWNVGDGIDVLFKRINDAGEYAQFAADPINDKEMQDAALVCIKRSQTFNQAYLDWKRETPRTFATLKDFFELRDKHRDEVAAEAGEFGFGGNAEENKDSQKSWDESVQHFANADSARQATIYNLTHTNMQQQQQLQAMQQQLSHYANAANNAPPAFGTGNYNYQPQQQYQQQGGNRNRGKKNNSYNGYNNQNGYSGNNTGNQNGFGGSNNGNRPQPPPNPVKRYENIFYC